MGRGEKMNSEVFKGFKFLEVGITLALFCVFLALYSKVGIPTWALFFIAIPCFIIILSALKTKVVIEDGSLRYERLGRVEKIELEKVTEILIREVEEFVNEDGNTINDSAGITIGNIRLSNSTQEQKRVVKKIIYLMDKEDQTFFSFPASMIRHKDRLRFIEAVKTVNANIKIS